MKKLIKFSALTKFMAVAAAAVALAGAVLLLVFNGETEPEFTFVNLGWSFAIRSLVATILSVALVCVYFLICYQKTGLTMGLTSSMGAAVSALSAFMFSVICRAPLSDNTLSMMLLGVVLSYCTSAVFFRSFGKDRPRGKKQDTTEVYETAANKAFVPMLIVSLVIALIAVAAFAVALIFKSSALCLYVLPVILTTVFSVVFTLSVACYLYTKKA